MVQRANTTTDAPSSGRMASLGGIGLTSGGYNKLFTQVWDERRSLLIVMRCQVVRLSARAFTIFPRKKLPEDNFSREYGKTILSEVCACCYCHKIIWSYDAKNIIIINSQHPTYSCEHTYSHIHTFINIHVSSSSIFLSLCRFSFNWSLHNELWWKKLWKKMSIVSEKKSVLLK